MARSKDFVYLDTFIWDTKKNEKNKKDHKISFENAVKIFNDPCLYSEYDKIHSENEDRFTNIGLVNGITLVTVGTTEQDGMIRIFAARRATKKEVRIYEQNAKTLQGY